jgi:hypothetical protein
VASKPRSDASSALQPIWVLRPISTTPLGLAPPRQARIHRHRVRMTTTPEPGRLPSDQPRPCGRSGPDCARFDTCTFQPRTRSLAAIRPGLVKRRGGRFKLPLGDETNLAARPGASGEDASHRCLQPTYDTSTLRTVRFPAAPPSALRLPSCADPQPELRATWVEHRLTATLQLRLSTHIVSRRDARDLPLAWRANEIPLGPGGCRDRRPLRRYPPAHGVFDREPSWRRSL